IRATYRARCTRSWCHALGALLGASVSLRMLPISTITAGTPAWFTGPGTGSGRGVAGGSTTSVDSTRTGRTTMPAERPSRDCVPNLESYEHERATFDLTAPERFNPVLDIVDNWADVDPDALALLSLDAAGDVATRHSAGELARMSRQAARALLDLGVGKGDAVFVMLPRVPAWYAALLGSVRIGAVPMPGPNLLTGKDIAY
ncbi:MAG: AMP-binding protein, partial [Pseudonocardiaceae bacterium]|nr:AMP-binding protein [Pseudonocardiaceae bacterium]